MIDAHAHLTDRRFAEDLPDVLDRARKAGIDRVLTAGEDIASSAEAIALARRYDEVRASVRLANGLSRVCVCRVGSPRRLRRIGTF